MKPLFNIPWVLSAVLIATQVACVEPDVASPEESSSTGSQSAALAATSGGSGGNGYTNGGYHDINTIGRVAGRSIQDLEIKFTNGKVFEGRIVALKFERYGKKIVASGRIVGKLNGRPINEAFENVPVEVFAPRKDKCENSNGPMAMEAMEAMGAMGSNGGGYDDHKGGHGGYDDKDKCHEGRDRCGDLYLNLAPIFYKALHLTVKKPNPALVRIEAGRGPSSLLHRELCALLSKRHNHYNGHDGKGHGGHGGHDDKDDKDDKYEDDKDDKGHGGYERD